MTCGVTLRAVDRVTIDELNDSYSCIRHLLQPATQHVQHVLVREKRAGEVEAHGQRMRLRRRREADNRSRYDALADAEMSHSVHRWTRLVVKTMNKDTQLL